MGKVADLDGAWLEDEAGHGIYDEAGMTESIAGALSSAGALIAKFTGARSNAGASTPAGANSRSAILYRLLSGNI